MQISVYFCYGYSLEGKFSHVHFTCLCLLTVYLYISFKNYYIISIIPEKHTEIKLTFLSFYICAENITFIDPITKITGRRRS